MTARRIQRVAVIEPATGSWSSNPKWGRLWKGPYPPAENTRQSIARIDNVPGPPQVVTVILGHSPIEATFAMPGNSIWNALITYGVGAVNHQFEIDWRAGVQLSVVASSVAVDAVARIRIPGAYVPVPGQEVTLSAGFGRGGAPQSLAPLLTLPGQVLAAGRNDIRVPLFASEWCVIPTQFGGDVDMYSANFLFNQIAGTFFSPTTWSPLAGSSGLLSLTNNTANAVSYQAIFRLSL